MKLYAVRLLGDHDAVGIYWTRGVDGLFFEVEETVDPCHCEYKAISGPASVVWIEECYKMGSKVQLSAGNGKDDEYKRMDTILSGMQFSNYPFGDLTRGDTDVSGWKAFRRRSSAQ
jgi:hypothetical protein